MNTEIRQLRHQVVDEPGFLQVLIDCIPAQVYAKDLQLRFLLANMTLARSYGVADASQLIGKTDFEFLPRELAMEYAKDEQRVLSGNPIVDSEVIIQNPDGSIQQCYLVTRVPIFDSNGTIAGLVGINRDVTERKRMEGELRQSQKMEALGQLAGGVAHDFNNQLAGIMGSAEILVSQISDQFLKERAEDIVKASKRSADLTKQLLTFARRGHKKTEIVDIHETIAEVLSLLKRSVHKNIRLAEDLSSKPCVVQGDSTQLQNALLNLAINARDAMPDGGCITFSTEVTELDLKECSKNVFDIRPGKFVLISIMDTGMGMDEETQLRIFEPFFTTKGKKEGTGLGLAAVYGTVQAHHGAIEVKSALGKGTTFKVLLPTDDSAAVSDSSTRIPRINMSDLVVEKEARVLVIEDEELIRSLSKQMLEKLGYVVETAEDGSKGIALFEQDPDGFDLVILDIVLPEMSGEDVFAALREINPGVRVLLSSGYDVDGEAHDILEAGANDFIQKPYQIQDLADKVASVLGEL